jgi:hypothetical protein
VTSAKRATAPKRRRPRVWDDAQVIVWIVHRTWHAVAHAKGLLGLITDDRAVLDAREGNPKGVRSVASPLAILCAVKHPNFADGKPTASWIGERYAEAENEFKNAIANEKLKCREDGRFNFKDVQDKNLWPSLGGGNSKKHFLDRDLLAKTTATIACGPDNQSRADVFRATGSKGIINRGNQKGLLFAAADKALRVLESAGHPLVITPSEAEERLTDLALSEKARKGLQQIVRMKALSPEKREDKIQRVKAFKKRTLRAK